MTLKVSTNFLLSSRVAKAVRLDVLIKVAP